MVGEDVDQRAFELLSVGMAEFRGGEFLKMIVQQPRIIDRGQQDKRLAARDRGAMAAMQRAYGEMRACRDIGFILMTQL